jgi:hypothetical protein
MSERLSFGGDRMRITEDDAGTATITFDDEGTGRRCGSCTLCCKVLPVPDLDKPAGTRCRHARMAKGCTIYATRPLPCRTWSCRWLADPDTAELTRPDRGHYVVDISYDSIAVQDPDTGRVEDRSVLQVWIDPAHREAYKAPELRRYLARRAAQHKLPALIRFNSSEAILLVAPGLRAGRGDWLEITTMINRDRPDRESLHRQAGSAAFVTDEPPPPGRAPCD